MAHLEGKKRLVLMTCHLRPILDTAVRGLTRRSQRSREWKQAQAYTMTYAECDSECKETETQAQTSYSTILVFQCT